MKKEVIKEWTFAELKRTVVSLVKAAEISVSTKDSDQSSGIYLLYIDNFSDEKIIPFYIGQTTNFQKRLRAHIKDIMELQEYSYAQYHNIFLWGALGHRIPFDGKFRPCKLFQYMIDHSCAIDDIKMVVLEKCNKEHLYEREQYYLNLYLPAFFGFNQILSITEQWQHRQDPAKLEEIKKKDYLHFHRYMEYGYSAFNYLHAFSYNHSDELDEKVNKLLHCEVWKSADEHFADIRDTYEEYSSLYKEGKEKISSVLGGEVHKIFECCHLKSKGRENEVIEAFANFVVSSVIDDNGNTMEYLDYYFDRNKQSRECRALLTELYNQHREEMRTINQPIMEAYKKYIDSRVQALRQSRFFLIFPKHEYALPDQEENQ